MLRTCALCQKRYSDADSDAEAPAVTCSALHERLFLRGHEQLRRKMKCDLVIANLCLLGVVSLVLPCRPPLPTSALWIGAIDVLLGMRLLWKVVNIRFFAAPVKFSWNDEHETIKVGV